jgi:hypothetical protein
MQGGQSEAKKKARGGLTERNITIMCIHVYVLSLIRYLRITVPCVYVINKPCARRVGYMCLISWTHCCGSEQ